MTRTSGLPIPTATAGSAGKPHNNKPATTAPLHSKDASPQTAGGRNTSSAGTTSAVTASCKHGESNKTTSAESMEETELVWQKANTINNNNKSGLYLVKLSILLVIYCVKSIQ